MNTRKDKWEVGRATLCLLITLVAYGCIGCAIPQFISVFDGLNTELPFITWWVIDTYRYGFH